MTEAVTDAQSATAQSDALDTVGLRQVVAVLSTVQIVSWGILYYAFAALQSSITAETGWSSVAVTGAFSLALLVSGGVGIWVGRHIDDFGPRAVMTAASLVAVPGVAAVALAPNLAVFYAGWVVTGVAMAGTLYPPAFAALTHWGGVRRVRALTTLTLVAGLASTVFAPLASVLDDWLGWRQAYLVLLAGLVLITVPLHWWGLNHPWRAPQHAERGHAHGGEAARARVGTIARSVPFLLLTLAHALTALAVSAVLINLVPMLVEQGMSRNRAALTLGLGGVGQVTGRLAYARFAAATSVTARGVIVLAGVAVATASLALAPASTGLLIAFGMLLGLARGIYTLVQATAVTDRWGPTAYGALNGILTAPALAASAVAPFAGAALAHVLGSYADAFLVLAGVAGLAAVLMLGATPRTRVDPPRRRRRLTGEDASTIIEAMNVEASPRIAAGVVRRAKALGALADPVRLRVLDALVLGDASPGELGSQLGMSSSLLAHHLGVLEREGIVARHRSQADRRRSYLHLVPGSLDDLLPGVTAPSSAGGRVPAAAVTRVVFVCTANSARSQLAAALWAQNSPVPGISGGTHPASTVAPGAAAVARRHGLRLDDSAPRLLPALTENDCLVTVCDNAHEDLAPSTLATARRRLHWSVPDPVPAGTTRAFEDAYVDLEGRIITLALHLTPRATQAGAR